MRHEPGAPEQTPLTSKHPQVANFPLQVTPAPTDTPALTPALVPCLIAQSELPAEGCPGLSAPEAQLCPKSTC